MVWLTWQCQISLTPDSKIEILLKLEVSKFISCLFPSYASFYKPN